MFVYFCMGVCGAVYVIVERMGVGGKGISY